MSIEELEIYCPMEKKRCPVWYCLGSYFQMKEPCEYVGDITISHGRVTEHKCLWKGDLK